MTIQKSKDWSVPIAIAIIGLVGTCITAFFAIPAFQNWVGLLFTPTNPKSLAIEQISQRVFPYYGEAENVGGFAKIELLFDGVDEKPSYEFKYILPAN